MKEYQMWIEHPTIKGAVHSRNPPFSIYLKVTKKEFMTFKDEKGE